MIKLKDIPAPVWYGIFGLASTLVAVYLAKRAAAAAGAALDPTSHDNVFNKGATAVGQAISGDKDFTFGAGLYNWLHEDEFLKSEREHQAQLAQRR